MYIKTDLTYSDTELTHLNASNADIESQWIVIKLHQTRPIIICNMYRPPSGNVTNALSTLSDAINTLTHPQDIYLIGDFNIDYKHHMSDNFKKIKFFERSNTLKQIITVPTRYSTTRNSLLDLILTNSTNYAYWVLGQNPTGQKPIGQYPSGQNPRRTKTQGDKIPWGQKPRGTISK